MLKFFPHHTGCVSKKTASALSQGQFVKLDTDTDYVITSTTQGDNAMIGTVLEDVSIPSGASFADVTVVVFGLGPVKLNGSISAGSWVQESTTAGRAEAIGAVGGTNYNAKAFLLEGGASGDVVTGLIMPSRPQG
ncbi:MAG: hypothetical protein IPK80_02680 [Nannocystis sp.]|nr:hypothetical protein [Nannocystis sp.]